MFLRKTFSASPTTARVAPFVIFVLVTAAQGHFGAAILQKNPEEYLSKDFAALAETMALAAGMKLESENKNVPTGLES